MIKSGYKAAAAQSGDFPVLPEDTYQAVIEDVNLVEQRNFNSGQPEEVLNFKFLVLEDGEHRGNHVWKKVRPILSAGFEQGQPSWLYELYKSAMKKLPDEKRLAEGLDANDINGLIGRQVRLIVKVKTSKKGREYNNVDGILPSKIELPMPKLKTKEPGEVQKLPPVDSENEEAEDIFADDEYADVNAKLAGKTKGELIGEDEIPVIND